MKISILDRILLLITGLLSAYQVATGIDGLGKVPTISYTIAFGILLLASLLIIILGMDILNSPIVLIVSTAIPLGLSLGLVWQYLPGIKSYYLVFVILGFLAIIFSRGKPDTHKLPTFILTIVHGIAGFLIFLIPSITAAKGITSPGFSLVGLGGALIGIVGLFLSFLKTGKPILTHDLILRILPPLLLLMTISFVIGFAAA